MSLRKNRRSRWWKVAAASALIFVAGGAIWLATYPWPDAVRTFTVHDGPATSADVQVDCFFPSNYAGGPLPAIISLHGSEGTCYYRKSHFSNARRLADEGYAVFLVHYFDPLEYEHLIYLDEDREFDLERHKEHLYGKRSQDRRIWVDVCNEAVCWAAEQPEVVEPDSLASQSPRIALVGYSLGGFVALSTANECLNGEYIKDGRAIDLRAVIVNFGARFKDVAFGKKTPPVYFFHGEDDKIVDVAYAQQTERELTSLGRTVRIKTYPGQGHVIVGEAAEDCRQRTYEFLRVHMAPSAHPEKTTSANN